MPAPDLVVHPETRAALQAVVARRPHAVVLTGPTGIGKGSLATALAADLLTVDPATYPYLKRIVPAPGQSAIPIDAVRELQHFMALKVPGTQPINRIAIIEQAELLGIEAQNALLKLLEEPPAGTVIILTAAAAHSLLPTIRSRLQTVPVVQPARQLVADHYLAAGFSAAAVQQAAAMTDGLPGAMAVLLAGDADAPLYKAVEQAREILQKSTFERLALVDGLAKQKGAAAQVILMLERMAHAALTAGKQTSAAQIAKWQHILALSNAAQAQLAANAQTKLVLTDLMLNI